MCRLFIVLFSMICVTKLEAQDGPKYEAYKKYIKVPYAIAFSELIRNKVENGDITFKHKDLKVIEKKLHYGSEGNWKPYPEGFNINISAPVFLGAGKVWDDQQDNYYVAESVFNTFKAELIPLRKGTIISIKKEKIVHKDEKNLVNFDTYVWDSVDKCYREPTRLSKINEK